MKDGDWNELVASTHGNRIVFRLNGSKTVDLLDDAQGRKEGVVAPDPTPDDDRFGVLGGINFVLLGGVVALVLMSGLWKHPPPRDCLRGGCPRPHRPACAPRLRNPRSS